AIGGGEASTDAAGPRRPRHLAGAALAGNGTPAGVTGQVELGGFDRAASDSDGVGPVRTGHTRGRWSGPADSGDPAADTDGAGLEGREPAAGREMPAGGTDWGIYATAIRRWGRVIGRTAPVPRITGP